jgi:hypothetical protein
MITAKITSRKPAGEQWFGDVSPANRAIVKSFHVWLRTVPGFVSREVRIIDDNTKEETLVFNTIEEYTAFTSSRTTNSDWIARHQYNLAHTIVTQSTESVS